MFHFQAGKTRTWISLDLPTGSKNTEMATKVKKNAFDIHEVKKKMPIKKFLESQKVTFAKGKRTAELFSPAKKFRRFYSWDFFPDSLRQSFLRDDQGWDNPGLQEGGGDAEQGQGVHHGRWRQGRPQDPQDQHQLQGRPGKWRNPRL